MPFQKDQCDPLMTWFELRNQTGYERNEKDTNFDQEYKYHTDAEHGEQNISTLSVKFIVWGTMLMKRESVLISYHKIDAHDSGSLFLSKSSWAQYNPLNNKNILI